MAPPAQSTGISYQPEGDSHRWSFGPPETQSDRVAGQREQAGRPEAACRPAKGSVECGAAVLEQIARDLARLQPGGGEIGGLLFGTVDNTAAPLIRIQSVDSYSAAALHPVLSVVRDRLAARRPSGAERSVVGWFRLDPSGQGLTPSDEALMRSDFPAPQFLLLLSLPSRAGFAFWEGPALRFFPAAFPELPQVAAPARRGPDAEPDAPRRPRRWLYALVVALALAGAGYWYSRAFRPPPQPPPVPTQPAPPQVPQFNLMAVVENKLVRISWEPQSPEVLHAVSGTLSTSDGAARIDTPLDTVRLSAGLFWYSPRSSHVRVRLVLVFSDGRKIERTADVDIPRSHR
jgi:hypothetical protein